MGADVSGAKREMDQSRRKQLLERIAGASSFHTAPSLRNLLLFLGDEGARHPGAELKEQDIGVRVFGRPAGYDTTADNIVRVQMSKLRKRLEEYFESEGRQDSETIEIPRGRYVLVFHPRSEPADATPSPPADPVTREPRPHVLYWLPLAGCALLAIICGWLWVDHARLVRVGEIYRTPAVRALWTTLFQSGQPTEVVLPDTSIGMFQDLIGRTFTLAEYVNQEYRKVAVDPKLSPDMRSALGFFVTRRATSSEEIRSVRKVLEAGTAYGQAISIMPSRDFQIRTARERNLVLVGGRKSNPWIELFDPTMNFQLTVIGPEPTVIRNRNPQPGEPEVFETRQEGLEVDGYGLLALYPNLSHNGQVLMILGTDTGAVEMAAEFLTEEHLLGQLWQKLGRPSVFPTFEAVLNVHGLDRSAKEMTLRAVRVHPKLP